MNDLTIFELEEGINYYCSFYGESVIARRENNKLMFSYGTKWDECAHIIQSWRFTEIDGQRNLCPTCKISMVLVPNVFHVERSQWYSGYRCPQCKSLYENKNDPHPKIQGIA